MTPMARPTSIPDLVNQLHNHVDLINGRSVEVLPYGQRQLLFAYPSLLLLPRHRWTLSTNARICEERLVEGRGEGGGCGQVVCDAVRV